MRTLAWYDVLFIVGLALIAAGLAWWSPPMALVATGAECVVIGVLAAVNARRRVVSPSPTPTPTHGTPEQPPA